MTRLSWHLPTFLTRRSPWPNGRAVARRLGACAGFGVVGAFGAGLLGCSPKDNGRGPNFNPEAASTAEENLGNDALQHGQLRPALVHARKALDFDENNANAELLTATIFLAFCQEPGEECRLAEAEAHAKKALKLKPEFGEARNTLGVILINEKKYDEAIEVLKPLTEDMVYNTPWVAWGSLGFAYLEKGDPDQAILSLRHAMALQPAYCLGGYRLGLAYERKKDLRAAQRAVDAAINTEYPQCKFADAYEARARILGQLGENDAAHADLERCAKVGQGTPTGKRCASFLGQPPP